MTAPLPWTHRITEIPDEGLKVSRSATPPELDAVTRALGILSCEALSADYVVKALGGGRYQMTGKLSALITQACVVTLEPVEEKLAEDVDVTFWPPGDLLPSSGEDEAEVLSLPEIEPIEHGEIEAGRVLFEILSASLDPYPRKPGARFEWEDAAEEKASGSVGPFAALKGLKDKS
jgi:uncharacterized metal-binding protein YceD (DUF177 family)